MAPKDDQKLDWVDAARLLREALEHKPDDFTALAKKLKIHARKAYYLVEVNKALDGLAIPKKRLLKVGWTKMQIIAPKLKSGNIDTLLALAEGNAAHELRKLIQGKAEDIAQHCMLLYLSQEQYAIVEKVLLAHGAQPWSRGLQGKEEALVGALSKLLSQGAK